MYHPRRTHHVTITPPLRQNNVANNNMPFCINNNHLDKSNLIFAHGKYIGMLDMIM